MATDKDVAVCELMETSDEANVKKDEENSDNDFITIYVMGKRYEVPGNLTIMKAMEYVGYRFIRGCGCRGGFCGACGTVYRTKDDYKLKNALACQTMVEDGMYLTQIPFYPANRIPYQLDELKGTPEEIFKLYPEVFRCVACNACTKACPMDIKVLDYVSAILLLLGIAFVVSAFLYLGSDSRFGVSGDSGGLRTAGIYRISRNPMYLGFYLVTLASLVSVPHPANVCLGLVGVYVHHRIVLAEERFLHKKHAASYEAYRRRVIRYM